MANSAHDQRRRDPYQKYSPSPSAPLNTPLGSGKDRGIKGTFSYKCGSNQSIGKLLVLSETVLLSTQNNIKIISNKIFTIYAKIFAYLQVHFTLTCFNRTMSVNGYKDLIEINLLWSSVKVWPCFAIGH